MWSILHVNRVQVITVKTDTRRRNESNVRMEGQRVQYRSKRISFYFLVFSCLGLSYLAVLPWSWKHFSKHNVQWLRWRVLSQLAFYVNLHRTVIGPSATLSGRWRPDIDLRRMLTGFTVITEKVVVQILFDCMAYSWCHTAAPDDELKRLRRKTGTYL